MTRLAGRGIALFMLALWLISPGLVAAQVGAGLLAGGEEASTKVDPTSAGAIAARRDAVATQLEELDVAIARSSAPAADLLHAQRESLERISALLAQQTTLLAPVEAVEEPPAVPAAAPSVFALNALLEWEYAQEESEQLQEAALEARRSDLDAAKERFEAAERRRRKARSEFERAEPGDQARARGRLQLRDLESRVAREEVHLRTLQTRAARSAVPTSGSGGALDGPIEAMREALARGEGDSEAGLRALSGQLADVRHRKESAERERIAAELRLEAAQNRFAQSVNPSAELLDEIQSRTARREAIRETIGSLDARLDRLGEQRDVWRRWEALLLGSPSQEAIEEWKPGIESRRDALAQLVVERERRAGDVERRLASIERRRSEAPEGSDLRRAYDDELDALAVLTEELRAEAAEAAADARLSERLLADVDRVTGSLDPLAVLREGMTGARETWSYEVTTVDDAPITVGSLVLALVLFGLGLWVARKGSALVAHVAEERFRLDAGAAQALQTLSFYALLVGFTLLALRAVHFPLTAFTVLGGALAIGIGFGSQNVMNNFISGLILMLERPVRARDVVEVDGNHGTVEKIGARSTQIRSTDGRHIIVPNSFFLENNVVNWTLSDDIVRAKVRVGVIYGSPTRLVEELIRRAVDEEPHVLASPEPIVVFDEFGDNSLNFDVYFWVNARSPMAMRRVESRIRFTIDDLFREHGLVIAFPQRDVHLDTVSPLEVRVVEGTKADSPAGPESDSI